MTWVSGRLPLLEMNTYPKALMSRTKRASNTRSDHRQRIPRLRRARTLATIVAGSVITVIVAGCGGKTVPNIVGMNPQEAIDAMHAADLNTNSHGGLGSDESTGYVVCSTEPAASGVTSGK